MVAQCDEDSLPVSSDLRASGDGRRELARTETRAIVVASEEGVGRIGEGVVCVPLALDARLAHGRVVGLEAVRDRQSATILIPGYS